MEYRTIKKEGTAEFTKSRSRFIGAARPVEREEQALDFLSDVRKRHWGAKHNVYAYILKDGGTARFSDDGEPPSTAGQPVMDILKKEELHNLCVVITRYFGGVLLGKGGLIRAYSTAAKMAVEAAGPVIMRLCAVGRLHCHYPVYGKLEAAAAEYGARILESDFIDEVRLLLAVDLRRKKDFEEKVADISANTAKFYQTGTRYIEGAFG